jgi:ABC-type sulfate transport system permease component
LHIAIAAVITAAVGLPVVWWRLRATYPGEAIILAALSGGAVFAWRNQRKHAPTQRRRHSPVQRE